jgi:hypothetical protein
MLSRFCVKPTSKRWVLKIVQVTTKRDPFDSIQKSILHWSLKRSVKSTWTGSTFSTNESTWRVMVTWSQSRVWSSPQCPKRFLGIIGQVPSVSKSNQLHVVIFQISLLIQSILILEILLKKWWVFFLKSWTSTIYFSNSTYSYVTSSRISHVHLFEWMNEWKAHMAFNGQCLHGVVDIAPSPWPQRSGSIVKLEDQDTSMSHNPWFIKFVVYEHSHEWDGNEITSDWEPSLICL